MIKSFRLVALALAIALTATVAGCTSTPAPAASGNAQASASAAPSGSAAPSADQSSSGPITLALWDTWGGGNEAGFLKDALDKFEKDNPNVKVEATSFEPDSFQVQGLKTAVAANEFGDVTYGWDGALMQPFVAAGKILCIDKYLTDDIKNEIMPGALGGMTFDGKVYGLPYLFQPCVVIYNKALFDKNGLQIPETYEDLVAAVKVFLSKGITPLCLGEKELWTGMMYYDMMAVRYLGADACNDALSGKTKFDSQGFLDVAKKFSDLISMKAFDPGAVSLSRYEAEMKFKMGQIPILLEGSWVLGDVLVPTDSAIKDTAVVKAFPSMAGSTATSPTDVLGGVNNTMMVNASTKHPDEAFKLSYAIIKSVALDCYTHNMGIAGWKVPSDLDVSGVNPYFVQVKDVIEKSQNSMLYWDNVLSADLTLTHKNLIQDMYAQKISPEDFVKKMQEAIDSAKS